MDTVEAGRLAELWMRLMPVHEALAAGKKVEWRHMGQDIEGEWSPLTELPSTVEDGIEYRIGHEDESSSVAVIMAGLPNGLPRSNADSYQG
jgi:hypothetical protein